MPEEGEKHLLYDFFRIVHGYAKREGITQERIAKLLEELHDLALALWQRRESVADRCVKHRAGRHVVGDLGATVLDEVREAEVLLVSDGLFERDSVLVDPLHLAHPVEPDDRAAVHAFLTEQQEIQRRLTARLRLDKHLGQLSGDDMIERNRRLVRAADRMSIAICTGMRDLAIRSDGPFEAKVKDVPTAVGETDLRLLAVGGDITNVVVTPWPFAEPRVRVSCEGIKLPPQRFNNDDEMRIALRNATRLVLSTDLRRS